MRPTLLAIFLLVPTIALAQSLGEVAKREKNRRERNKEEGKKVRVITEEEIFPEEEETDEASEDGTEAASSSNPRSSANRSTMPESRSEEGEYGDEEGLEPGEEEALDDLPDRIPPDAPLEQRLELFQRMKRQYEQQVKEIDSAIAENEERLRQLDMKIRETSTVGGSGGPPVAPQMPSGDTVNTQLTGQESQKFVEERDKLQQINQRLVQRKQQLKNDLQAKGRVANIPPGYLRF